MLRATFVVALLLVFIGSGPVLAQNLCSTANNNLICVIPQLYSTTGGVNLPNQAHRAHFDSDFQKDSAALSSSVGTELASLRLASPTSGITFVFENGVMKRTTESYGPILGERAETIGRHRIFVAGTYQYFPFSTLDGIDLKHLPAVYNHGDTVNPDGTHRNPAVDPPSLGNPGVELEYISTTNRIDLKVHQFTFYATYGLTNRIDVSVAIPILNVRMGISSQATIVRGPDPIVQGPALLAAYIANPNTLPGNLYPSTGPMEGCAPSHTCSGYFHYFDQNNPATSLTAAFSNAKSASGIGDVVFRAKGTIFKHERTAVALGADVRVPTGDEKNFVGTGAAGVKPFLSASYHSRLSPHANIGYEFNGSSILAGDPVTGTKGRLPDQLFYSGGVDAGVTKKLTLAVDLLGQRFYDAPGVKLGAWEDVNLVAHPEILNTIPIHRSFNTDDLALGAKYSPFGNWLVTGNVQIKLDDGGLRAKVVPLIGVSYTF
ncbi:MAG: hypothetical protein DMG82_13570 [Acidobacteria bacterium]|nr:MAG: hypothetical protein DMG82_13570 [Acidobacteriota bacterium]PYX47615.1 MAG: hypothetical protein DMG83_04085 [Acidobacteriota bacterium]